MTVYCRDCDLVHPDTRKQEPWRWRCMARPVPPGFGFVDPDYSPSPPYELCKFTRFDENCEMFTPRRVAPEEKAA